MNWHNQGSDRAALFERLTPAHRRVALLIADGFTNDAIAAEIGRTINTVEKHVTGIAERLQLDRSRNRRALIAVIADRSRRAA